jgi:hypothetical protein
MRTMQRISAGLVLAVSIVAGPACTHAAPAKAAAQEGAAMLSEADARRIAAEDAATRYKDLKAYDVSARLENDAWHIDYTPRGGADGGGPAYVIDARSGQIVSKKYYQ